MTIRPAVPTDTEQLVDLLKAFGSVHEPELNDRISTVIDKNDSFLIVAENDGKLTGYVWVQSYGRHLRSGHITARLNDLFVLPEFRNQNIGRQLFEATKEWAKHNGVKYLQWQANSASIPFYEKLGLTGDTKSDLEEHPFYEIEF